jgi:hypothetical protein
MLGYPGALWFAGDSYVYLGAALRLRPDLSKTTGYSLFLRALEPLHSLTLVAGLQHLMGLGIAVMIYLLLRRAGGPPRWATAATLPVLLDGFEIEDEHMVMAEALFTFLVMAALLLIRPGARIGSSRPLHRQRYAVQHRMQVAERLRLDRVQGEVTEQPVVGHAARYGRAVPSRVVEPFAVLIAGYERVVYTYGPLFGLILVTGLGGVLRISRSRRGVPRLAWVPRTGSMLPWVTAIVLLVFPIAVADFDLQVPAPGPAVGRGPGLRARRSGRRSGRRGRAGYLGGSTTGRSEERGATGHWAR